MTALMLALAGVFTIISKMVSIPFIRFASFSAAPSVIIFTSIFLGPLAGAIVGAGSDVIGLLYWTGAYNPIYTVNAALMGVLPYLLVLLTKRFRKVLSKPYILYAMLALVLGLLAFLFFGTSYFDSKTVIGVYGDNYVWIKATILGVYFVFDIVFVIGMYYLNKHFKKSVADKGDFSSPYEIGFICVIVEILIDIFAKGGAMEFYYYFLSSSGFRISYWIVVLVLSAMFTPNVLFNTFFAYEFLYLANKQIAPRGRK